jgi:predicted Zn-dependent peptidase
LEVFENKLINEKVYKEVLDNGLEVYLFPRKNVSKKVIMWGTKFGAVDNDFSVNGERITVPDGIAHYLEHKMFEQRSGINALDKLTSIGVDANAYTGSTETVYLYECTDNFYDALDEFMDYVQNPYFTDQNVDKERGIIEQEIMMYDDYPENKVYYNLMECLYHNNAIRIPVAGTVETIANIDKEKLYTIYNTFYVPNNMKMVIAGDFELDSIVEEIKKYMTMKRNDNIVTRNYPEEPDTICKDKIIQKMEVSIPLFLLGYKLKRSDNDLKKSLAIDILSEVLFGKSSNFFNKLYKQGLLYSPIEMTMEYDRNFSTLIIDGESKDPEKVISLVKEELGSCKINGINEQDFSRIKKNLFGKYLKEFNDLTTISNKLIGSVLRGETPLVLVDLLQEIDINYINKVLQENFEEDKSAYSIIMPNN